MRPEGERFDHLPARVKVTRGCRTNTTTTKTAHKRKDPDTKKPWHVNTGIFRSCTAIYTQAHKKRHTHPLRAAASGLPPTPMLEAVKLYLSTTWHPDRKPAGKLLCPPCTNPGSEHAHTVQRTGLTPTKLSAWTDATSQQHEAYANLQRSDD